MMFQFVIPGRLCGANELRYADRSHWATGAKIRKEELELCCVAVRLAKAKQDSRFTQPVSVYFQWIERNERRDLDNIMGGQKAILDALVVCGVIPDDSRKYIREIRHSFPPANKNNARIEVCLYDD